MDFKAGDKVKLARTDGEWDWYKEHLGETFTIKKICEDWSGKKFAELEENNELMPFVKNLELVRKFYTYEDLKKSPIGTKITFEDGKTLVKVRNDDINDSFTDINAFRSIRDLKGLKDSWLEGYLGKIIKIEEPEYTTVYECEPEILDNIEKKYLKDVIRPFRDRVNNIRKVKSYTNNKSEYIIISIGNENITLPYFEENAMYKGMRLNKEYTLEELGI